MSLESKYIEKFMLDVLEGSTREERLTNRYKRVIDYKLNGASSQLTSIIQKLAKRAYRKFKATYRNNSYSETY